MIRSLGTAEKAMQMEQNRIDALANNLANVDTAGFKQILTRVAEVNQGPIPGGETDANGQPQVRPQAPPSLQLYHALDNRPGTVRATGRATDVAIMEAGFFEIQTPDGPAYTRHGSFLLDSDHHLTTPDGHPVMGEGGPLRMDGTEFSIANDGTVMVDGEQVDRLKLVAFDDPTRLEHLGSSLVRPPEGLQLRTMDKGEVVLAQGHVEGSNVNPIDTLIALISAQRAFEVQSRVMTTEDEMLEKSVNNLPRANG